MREQSSYKDIFQKIKAASNALIIAHQNPDGDAIGAALTFSHLFERYNKPHQIYCQTETPSSFSFLPGIERVSSDAKIIHQETYDAFLVLDCGDLDYAGLTDILPRLKPKPLVINIDHHPTNTHFGDINLVETASSATADIIFRLLDHNQEKITKEMATCLLCGIITDTGSFSNLATTPEAMRSASELMLSGARVKQIITNTLANYPLPTLKLWGKALSRLAKNSDSKLVTTIITLDDIKECGVNEKAVEGIANFLNSLDDTKVVLVLREKEDGTVKGSLRTTHPDIDVSKLAKALGGGGHKKAAGFTIPGRILETEKGWKIV